LASANKNLESISLKLTPLEIKKQEFKKSMRGYDADEVISFLDMVAANYEEMQAELSQYKEQSAVMTRELENYKNVEKTLRSTLVNLQESAEQSKANSEKEGSLIIKEAQVKAAETIEKAKNQTDRIKDEIRLLKSQKESLVKRLKHLLSSHLELIDMLEIEEEPVNSEDKGKTIINKESIPVVSHQEEKQKKLRVSGIVQSNKTIGEENNDTMGTEIDKIIENLEKQKRK